MAISLVGTLPTGAGGGAANGGNVTVSLPVGTAQGDYVIVIGGHPHREGSSLGPSTSGYTPIFSPFATQSPNFGAWYKLMGASPDSQFVGFGTGDASDSAAYSGWVLRGVAAIVIDTTPTTTGPTTSTNPDAPAITTVTDGAWVLTIAASTVVDGTQGTPSGYENFINASGIDTNNISVAGATIVKASAGAENPGEFPTWSSGTWYAATIAIRPFVDLPAGAGHLMMLGLGR